MNKSIRAEYIELLQRNLKMLRAIIEEDAE